MIYLPAGEQKTKNYSRNIQNLRAVQDNLRGIRKHPVSAVHGRIRTLVFPSTLKPCYNPISNSLRSQSWIVKDIQCVSMPSESCADSNVKRIASKQTVYVFRPLSLSFDLSLSL